MSVNEIESFDPRETAIVETLARLADTDFSRARSAFELLRAYARRHQRQLTDVALEVVRDRLVVTND